MKKTDWQKYQPYLAPLVVGMIVVLTASTFLKPKIAMIWETKKELGRKRQTLARLSQKVAALEGLDRQQLDQKTQKVLEALPAEKDAPRLIATFKAVAQETGISLATVNVSPGELASESALLKAGGDSPLLEFKVDINGDLAPVLDFAARLKTVLPLMRVVELDIGQAKGEGLDASLKLQTFFLALPSQIGKVDQPLATLNKDEKAAYQRLLGFRPILGSAALPAVPTGRENLFNF